MLRRDFLDGYRSAFRKFALAPPTQVDGFVDAVERGKDVPPDPSTLTPSEPPVVPPPVGNGLGGTPGLGKC